MVIFLQHSQLPPSHFPVVTSDLTDSRHEQFMSDMSTPRGEIGRVWTLLPLQRRLRFSVLFVRHLGRGAKKVQSADGGANFVIARSAASIAAGALGMW